MSKPPSPFSKRQVAVGNVVIKWMSMANTWIYRRTNGKLGGKFKGGAPVALFTFTGRKSGEPRTVPLLYLEDGNDLIIVASKGGMPRDPEWYLNFVASPIVRVRLADREFETTGVLVGDDQRATVWARLVEMYPDYQGYQLRTDRTIPIIRLSPVDG